MASDEFNEGEVVEIEESAENFGDAEAEEVVEDEEEDFDDDVDEED